MGRYDAMDIKEVAGHSPFPSPGTGFLCLRIFHATGCAVPVPPIPGTATMPDIRQPSEPGLYRIVYDSVVRLPFGVEGEQGIEAILAAARARNAALGITGVLYYDGAYFLQVLEGPQAGLAEVFASILADDRHGDVRIVERGPVARRGFAGWDMAWVTEVTVAGILAHDPDLAPVRPFRGAEVVATLSQAVGPAPR